MTKVVKHFFSVSPLGLCLLYMHSMHGKLDSTLECWQNLRHPDGKKNPGGRKILCL